MLFDLVDAFFDVEAVNLDLLVLSSHGKSQIPQLADDREIHTGRTTGAELMSVVIESIDLERFSDRF